MFFSLVCNNHYLFNDLQELCEKHPPTQPYKSLQVNNITSVFLILKAVLSISFLLFDALKQTPIYLCQPSKYQVS